VRESWLLAALWVAVAIVVVVATGPEHLSRKHSKQEPTQYEIATPPIPRVA
jgi:hypothetical protein